MNNPYVFEVNAKRFNELVLMNSYKLPVIVEFMAVYSGPAIALENQLNEFAEDFKGQFIFAKVDIDEQPELKEQYQIKNIPTLKVFKDTHVIRTEEGLMQKDELAEMLKNMGIYRQSDELREQARQKHLAGDVATAIGLLTQAIKMDPANTRVAMDMVQVMLDIGELDQAKSLFNRLPEKDRNSDTGKALIGQITFKTLAAKTPGKPVLLARLDQNPLDFDAYFDLAVCLVAEFDYAGALECLFAIFEQEPAYKEGAAREMIVNLLAMLAPSDPELVQRYRLRLGNALA